MVKETNTLDGPKGLMNMYEQTLLFVVVLLCMFGLVSTGLMHTVTQNYLFLFAILKQLPGATCCLYRN